MVLEAARQEDRLARNLLDRLTRPLGRTLAGAVNLFDPEGIIVGGDLAREGNPLLERLRGEVEARALAPPGRKVKLVRSDFDDTSTLLGGGGAGA